EQGDDDDQQHRETEQRDQQVAVDEDRDRILFAHAGRSVEARQEPLEEPLTPVGDDDAEERDEGDAAPQQRRGRVEPVPLAVGEGGHSPARRVSASATRWSRSSSASSSARPGTTTPVAAAAVTSFSSARPRARASG